MLRVCHQGGGISSQMVASLQRRNGQLSPPTRKNATNTFKSRTQAASALLQYSSQTVTPLKLCICNKLHTWILLSATISTRPSQKLVLPHEHSSLPHTTSPDPERASNGLPASTNSSVTRSGNATSNVIAQSRRA